MRIFVADIPVDNLSMEEALHRIEEFLSKDEPHFAVAINPEKILKACKDDELLSILKKSDLNFVDGIGVIWASKIFYKERFKGRIPGIDLFLNLLNIAERKGYSVFLLGSKEETLKKAIENLRKDHPKLKIAGYHNGYFKDEKEIVNQIKNSKADLLFVGMGSPKQEKFICHNLPNLNVQFAMGVGGSFNVLAGEYSRAPSVIQKLGLEWFYRFILDPRRLPRVMSLPKFIFLVMRMPQKIEEEVDLFGVRISNRSLEENLKIVNKFLDDGKLHLIVTLNGEMASKAFQDKEFFAVLKNADLIIPDGIGIVWGAKMRGKRIVHRIPGIEFAWNLLKLAEKKSLPVYFLGAKESILARALETIKKSFPQLQISGCHSGYFEKSEESAIINKINETHTKILFVGMGGGKQEKWIARHKNELNVPVAIGVGGSFDVWSGHVKRAPKFVQNIGLEWLYRMIIQPTRFARLHHIVSFAFKVLFKSEEGK